MSTNSNSDLAHKFKHVAQVCFEKEDYGSCFANLLAAFKLNPLLKNDLKLYFAITLCAWGKSLEAQGQFAALFACYETAMESFPENELIINNLGAHLLRLHHHSEALHYFKEALKLNNNYLPAYRNLQTANNYLVERWHYRMLNDSIRNEAFCKAIHKKIKLGFDSVLDIGTGSGLLSLYAMEGGAKNIYACDYSKSMIGIASNVLKSNDASGCIKLINKLSDDIQIPEDIPHRLSFIVTETLDAGLLGEHILKTVLSAWDNLLLPHDGTNCSLNNRVIPHSAILVMAPIECQLVAVKNKLFRNKMMKREKLYEIDSLNFGGIRLKNASSEPYDTEDLKLIKGHFKFICDAMNVLHFNFNNPTELNKYLFEGVLKRVRLVCTSSGYFDAVAVWFHLQVDDDIFLNTSPNNKNDSCWDQAIFPNHFLTFVEAGMLIIIDVICEQGKLSFNIVDIQYPDICHESSMFSKEILTLNGDIEYSVSECIIKFLNCESLINALINVKNDLSSNRKSMVSVLDLSPFPILGFLMAASFGSRVLSLVRNMSELEFVSDFARINNINKCLVDCRIYDQDLLKEVKFDVVVPQLFEPTGELNEDSLYMLRKIGNNLKDNAIIVPDKISVWCQLIQSDWLYKCSLVQNKELEDHFKVAEFINEFKVSQWIDLNLKSIPYFEMSEKFQIGSLTIEELCSTDSLVLEKSVQTVTGMVNALVYWFEYEIGGTKISTFQNDSHINQAAELFFPAISTCKNLSVKIKLTYNSNIFRFEVVK